MKAMRIAQRIAWVYGWVFVRPRRWLFHRMICATSPQWLPKRSVFFEVDPECRGYRAWDWPNIHWWLLYLTVFKFFSWVYWSGWRHFARREYMKDGRVWIKPTRLSNFVRWFGRTTAGFCISGNECFHCGSERGDQVDLSDDDTGTTFILEGTADCPSEDGTDHRFWGTTICPVCGYRAHYEDGSL